MNNKCVDQPVYLLRLISAFNIRFLEHIISKVAKSKISIFYLVSVAEETGLSLALSESLKTGFVMLRPICCHVSLYDILNNMTISNYIHCSWPGRSKVFYHNFASY